MTGEDAARGRISGRQARRLPYNLRTPRVEAFMNKSGYARHRVPLFCVGSGR